MEIKLQDQVGRFISFFSMIEADIELRDEELKDTDTIVSFMSSSASDALTVKNFRDLRDAYVKEYCSEENH